MKLERSDVEFAVWRKKVDKSLFEHNGTTVPEWVCRMCVGGGEKLAHFGGRVWTGGVVTARCWRLRNTAWWCRGAVFLRWTFSFFGALGTIRPALNLEDDRSFHDAIEESHGDGPIGQILAPFFEVHVGG